jgi:lipid-A-disaccharide synthase
MDQWRELLYPLGFLSSVLFGGRILVQWLTSEMKQESVVPKLFWQLSLLGNIFLMIHSFIQVQYHVFIIQVGNAVISWRNLDLMKSEDSRVSLNSVVTALALSLTLFSFIFFILNGLSGQDFSSWFRMPAHLFSSNRPVNFNWHIIGFIGLTLFSSRFWIQWISSERQKTSVLNACFWWISLIGDLIVLVYFAKIKDPVNLIGPLFGLIPYIRNLMLLKKTKQNLVKVDAK